MPRPPHLNTADYEAYGIVEYQVSKRVEPDIWDVLVEVAEMFNAAEDENPKVGKLEICSDAIIKLPNGSYVTINWRLEVMDPAEAEAELKDLGEAVG